MIKPKFVVLAAALTVFLGVTSGCSDGTELKRQVQQALIRQADMRDYRLTGSADLQLGYTPSAKDSNPLTAGLFTLLKESRLEWKGVASRDPAQLEIDFSLTPKGSSGTIAMPFLMKDNKLYFRLPMTNLDDEYFVEDLARLGGKAGAASSADIWNSAPHVSAALAEAMFNGIDAKWFKRQKAQEGSASETITVDINSKNEQEATKALQTGIAQLMDSFRTGGFISAEQANQWKQDGGKVSVHGSGRLAATIDEQGFIRELQMTLPLSITDTDGHTSQNQIGIDLKFDDINEHPKFEKDVPKQVRSFDEVLKLLDQLKK